MTRTIVVPIVLCIILMAMAGCTTKIPDATPHQESTVHLGTGQAFVHWYNGTSTVTESAVCVPRCRDGAYVSAPETSRASDTIRVPENFTHGFITATWEMPTQDAQELHVWVAHHASNSFYDWRDGFANGTGKSPITIAFTKDDLKPNGGAGLGVFFTTHGPAASVLIDQEVRWEAVLLSTP